MAKEAKTKKGIALIIAIIIILSGIITFIKLYQKYHMIEKHSKHESIAVHRHNE